MCSSALCWSSSESRYRCAWSRRLSSPAHATQGPWFSSSPSTWDRHWPAHSDESERDAWKDRGSQNFHVAPPSPERPSKTPAPQRRWATSSFACVHPHARRGKAHTGLAFLECLRQPIDLGGVTDLQARRSTWRGRSRSQENVTHRQLFLDRSPHSWREPSPRADAEG